ncbi:hypothetical protein FJZ21_03370 [Candidatus Pacearchaeota archaeon]|nr:hypothetical protein [Candidatus Pacearchaeota archaeon]
MINPIDFKASETIKMNMVHGLDQLSSRYQSIKDGLPELIKNSKDHYFRLGVSDKTDRQIVVIISEDKTQLGVLDFAGAQLSDFNGWEEWNSQTANRKEKSENIEAGFGNGGKSFMVRGCLKRSSLCGYINGKINKKGFINDSKDLKYKTVTFQTKDNLLINDLKDSDFKNVLNKEIEPFGISFDQLPIDAKNSFLKRKSFTLVHLYDLKDWKKVDEFVKDRKIRMIPADLMSHAQASLTIETCFVWVQRGDKLVYPKSLEVTELEPMSELRQIEFLPLPSELEDPVTGEMIKINVNNNDGLQIFPCNQNLRNTDTLKARNVVRIWNDRNLVANWSLADLAPTTMSGFIHAKLVCTALTEEYQDGSTRMILVDSDLTRALRHWTIKKLNEVISNIQELQSEKESVEDKLKASKALDKIRELMSKFLEQNNENNLNPGDNDTKRKPQINIKWGQRLDEIVLESKDSQILKVAKGVNVPIIIKGYELNNGNRLPLKSLPPFFINSEEDIVDLVSRNSIKGEKSGKTKINLETRDAKIKSNKIELEVIKLKDIQINYEDKLIRQGERFEINIIGITEEGEMKENISFENSIDEEGMGKINRSGIFIAGTQEGIATIRIRYGEGDEDFKKVLLKIGKEKINNQKSSDIPLIMFCGDIAPGRENWPENQRTIPAGESYPTIIDSEPFWLNIPPAIIWINARSKEAKKIREIGNEKRLVSMKSRTFQDFLLVKCFEILKRLKLKQKISDSSITFIETLQRLSQSETESSEFLDLAQQIINSLMQSHKEDEY